MSELWGEIQRAFDLDRTMINLNNDFGQALGASYAVFAVPGVLGLMLLANTIFLGLASDELSDAALEWWSRCAGWIAIAAVVWAGAGFLLYFVAVATHYLFAALEASAASRAQARKST